MQRQLTAVLAAALFATAAVAQDKPAATQDKPTTTPDTSAATSPVAARFKSTQEMNGYALGMQIGSGIHSRGLEVDPASFAKGFVDAFSGKTLLTEEEMHTVLKAAQADYQQKQAALLAAKTLETQKAGDAFLAANKAKDGVVTLPSGLEYKILKAGDGKKPTGDDSVVCNYRGTLIDGTEFDNSEKHDGPATFQVKGVIPGWTEALQLMPVGSKWQLYVPPSLAYGESGAGDAIPPNATLVFDVELLSIKEDKAPAKDDKGPTQ